MISSFNEWYEKNEPHIKNAIQDRQAKEWAYDVKKILENSSVSDEVNLCKWNLLDWQKLRKAYLNKNDNVDFHLPVDLFMTKTVPIKDILVKEQHTQYRVTIRTDYVEKIDLMKTNAQKPLIVGAVDFKTWDKDIQWNAKYALVMLYGIDKVLFQRVEQSISIPYELDDTLFEKGPLESWYLLQLSFLNPYIKNVYKTPKETIKYQKISDHKTKKRITVYKKLHVINVDDLIISAENKESKTINRKCLCWYVIGHWREYKDGRKVFIQGYWKGALRETKKNYDDGRERIIEMEVIE